MKIVSAHQPHFLPWMGYFNKVIKSDVFVWLEDVQYRKNYFQNRTKVKSSSGELWLSIPVKKAPLDTKILSIEIAQKKAVLKTAKTIRTYYSKAPYFKNYFQYFEDILSKEYILLNELNYDLFNSILKLLNIKTEVIRSVDILSEEFDSPNKRLLQICKSVKATHYIAGKGGKNYMNEQLFVENNINILWQDFSGGSIQYPQLHNEFIAGLSILDPLFNLGVEETLKLIQTPWET